MCRWVSGTGATRPVSPRGVLDNVVDADAGARLHRLFRWPHDRSVVADVRHGEPMRPGELADGRHHRIGGRPADTDVYQVFANGVVGDRQPRTATIKIGTQQHYRSLGYLKERSIKLTTTKQSSLLNVKPPIDESLFTLRESSLIILLVKFEKSQRTLRKLNNDAYMQ